ncbi:hypothetical protein AMK13_28750 [Streptomyces sp. CB02056]|nr:hypothetical protein AMK13_28750 [Streptomyces sp. CB02056]
MSRAELVGPDDPHLGGTMSAIYEPPALHEVGDFDELTKCLGIGSCQDFVGCGYAVVCFF